MVVGSGVGDSAEASSVEKAHGKNRYRAPAGLSRRESSA